MTQNTVYKSQKGRDLIEGFYRKTLLSYSGLPFKQFFVPTSFGKTHTLRFGDISKPPLVMLHGSMSNSSTWLDAIKYFSENFCIYCIDIPGEPGLSDPVRIPLDSNLSSTWLSEVLEAFEIQKILVVSMSLGSWYALNFSIENPGKIVALSIITSCGIAPQKISFLFKALFFMMLGRVGQKLLTQSVFHKTEVPSEVLEFQALASQHFKPLTQVIPIFNDDQLKKIIHPVQYFGGDHDSILDTAKTAQRLKTLLPNCEVNILKDTGHVIIDQFPSIVSFLERNNLLPIHQ